MSLQTNEKIKKKKGLFMVQLPPPIHGVSVISQLITQSKYINEKIDIDIIPINSSLSLDEINEPSFRKIFKIVDNCVKLFLKLLKNRYEFVYFTSNLQGWAFYRDILYIAIIKLFKIPKFYHLHGYAYLSQQKRRFKTGLCKWYFKGAKVIILADSLYNDISSLVEEKNKFILHNGIPITVSQDKFNSIVKERQNQQTCRILFFSNIMESKGATVLLKALCLLKDKGCIFKAIFAGKWINQDYKIIFTQLTHNFCLDKHIELKGFCSGKRKEEVFSQSDIFVFPTLKDTWAIVILEAMEYALPVVSSEEGAIPEIITDGKEGYIVKKNDYITLAEKIETLINDKQLRLKLGENARKKVLENYSFTEYEKNFIKIINS